MENFSVKSFQLHYICVGGLARGSSSGQVLSGLCRAGQRSGLPVCVCCLKLLLVL